jgi:PAS domain S-box-containing protein
VREQEAENARLAAIVASSGNAIVSVSAETRRILTWNRAAERLFGWTEAEAVGADVGLLVPPDLPEGEPGGVFHWAMEGHPVQDHETERMTRDGQRIPVSVTASRMVSDGRVVGVASLFRDLRPRREAEARQQALLREVDHRAKNALAVVQSVVRLTRADSAQEFSRVVEGRIGALARAHTLLAQQEWRGAMLHEVLQQELGGWDGQRPDGSRVLLSGPPVRLCSTAVQPLAMVMHELTANAARHGALSLQAGRIEVAWGFGTDGRLRLHWTELNGPPVRKPPRRGFGNSVVEATMRTQLGGEARLEWEPQGLACTLILGPGRATRGGVQQGVAEPPRPATPADTTPLRGRRVLLAEDEPLMGIELRAMLEELGCIVLGPAATFEETQALAASERGVDAAVLDVNLEGRPSFPVADLLAARGVPVAFVTAHGDLPSRAAADGRTALMRKPLDRATLAATLRHLLAASRADSGRGVA